MMLKRILISLLAICFMIPSIKSGSVVADVNKAANTPESCVSVYAVITAAEQEYCVASGKQDCLTYAYVETAGEDDPSIISKEYTVPQDFFVSSDGKVWVLDTGSKSIACFDAVGKEISRTAIENVIYAKMFAVCGRDSFVLDGGSNAVFRITESGTTKISLPMVVEKYFEPSSEVYIDLEYEMAPLVADMYCRNNILYLETSGYGTYRCIVCGCISNTNPGISKSLLLDPAHLK